MSDQRRLPYQPALDGLRAVAVALVLVFHAGYPWMSGGYIGVSMFFTLSGYLITSLLLAEHDRTGGLALPGFYARRMKRLLPASLLCLIAVIVGSQYGAFAEVSGLRRDVLGSLLQVENWVKLLGSSSYADLTSASLGRVGPLEHYWSLAVEEQFYWLWPVVMLVILRLVRRPARRAATLATLAVAGVAAAFLIAAVWGANAAYWATPARLGEILVGAALAGLLHVVRRVPTWTRWTGLPAVAVIAWAAITWPSADGPAYHGWLAMLALATAALILALQTPSVLRTALSWRPLVWIGTVSYGIYLFHWPVYAWLTDSSLGWSRTTLFAVEVAITMAVTTASFYLLERPVRRWSPINRVPLAFGLLASASLALVAVVVIAPPAGRHLANAATALQPVSQPLVSLAVAAPTSSGAAVVPGPP
ncbi:MAG: acyltransferase, partial [Ilumatobacteraceae bacterium]